MRDLAIHARLAARPVAAMAGLFLLVALLRVWDTFWLRSDQRFGEQVVAKGAGLLLVLAYLWLSGVGMAGIGFQGRNWQHAVLVGGGVMLAGLGAGYLVEWLSLAASGARPSLLLSVRGYALVPKEGAAAAVGAGAVVVLLGNAVNSFLEEGLFRGVMMGHLVPVLGPTRANLLQAALFGIWHLVWPLREVLDGSMGISTALGLGAGYTVLSFLIGLAFGWLLQGTGSLWAPWVAHTLNNSAYNVLQIVTAAGVEGTMGLRAAVVTVVVAALSRLL
ncbi:MAG: CPBP family intramembrane metalloprotease [Limnochordaceae bacterium]|nr:CPBP family intramembrane metalloprotease [Limnochordaceae bacterium]